MKNRVVKKVAKRKIMQKEATIMVTSTVLNSSKRKSEKIKIRPFATETATVGIKYGTTIPTADYSNVKVDVFISAPCYLEEAKSVFDQCCELAQEWMDEQVQKVTGKINGG